MRIENLNSYHQTTHSTYHLESEKQNSVYGHNHSVLLVITLCISFDLWGIRQIPLIVKQN